MKIYLQQDQMDCGPTCIRMVAAHYNRNFSLQRLRGLSGFSREGVSLLGIADAAEQIGFRAKAVKTITSPLILKQKRTLLKNKFKINNMKNFVKLSKNEMKNILGGDRSDQGGNCSLDKLGLCGANCQRSSGAADKCKTNSAGGCTCGGI